MITSCNNDTSKSTSWKILETALSHLKLLFSFYIFERHVFLLALRTSTSGVAPAEFFLNTFIYLVLHLQFLQFLEIECSSTTYSHILGVAKTKTLEKRRPKTRSRKRRPQQDLGSITSRCSGKEPALLPELFSGRNVDQTRESGGNRA